jgi:hypothetical protein
VPRRPDNLLEFRLGRLLILFEAIPKTKTAKPSHMERLGYYDFFADNPFLVLDRNDPDRRRLQLAGFSPRTLSYNSSAQRFTNRRARLQHDLALLASRSLVTIEAGGRHVVFSATEEGRALANELRSLYAEAFRASAIIVVRRLNKISDKALGESAQEWLRAESFLVDLYGHGEEAR